MKKSIKQLLNSKNLTGILMSALLIAALSGCNSQVGQQSSAASEVPNTASSEAKGSSAAAAASSMSSEEEEEAWKKSRLTDKLLKSVITAAYALEPSA